mmetsp:Transcript_3519/g.7895  ORF Transcript_3519/g.7895 Transcript_3519/m.7895 type:complete len:224 (+) Transcript_3519:1537-2208(+)
MAVLYFSISCSNMKYSSLNRFCSSLSGWTTSEDPISPIRLAVRLTRALASSYGMSSAILMPAALSCRSSFSCLRWNSSSSRRTRWVLGSMLGSLIIIAMDLFLASFLSAFIMFRRPPFFSSSSFLPSSFTLPAAASTVAIPLLAVVFPSESFFSSASCFSTNAAASFSISASLIAFSFILFIARTCTTAIFNSFILFSCSNFSFSSASFLFSVLFAIALPIAS